MFGLKGKTQRLLLISKTPLKKIQLKRNKRFNCQQKPSAESLGAFIFNEQKFVKGKFSWQAGYGAFSYSKSHIERVYNCIFKPGGTSQKENIQAGIYRSFEKL